MLTGDKLETAVQIAQSSSICSKNTELMKIAEKSFDAVLNKLQHFKNKAPNERMTLMNHPFSSQCKT
jgi:magnesium-transporting ATPase (P-type)